MVFIYIFIRIYKKDNQLVLNDVIYPEGKI